MVVTHQRDGQRPDMESGAERVRRPDYFPLLNLVRKLSSLLRQNVCEQETSHRSYGQVDEQEAAGAGKEDGESIEESILKRGAGWDSVMVPGLERAPGPSCKDVWNRNNNPEDRDEHGQSECRLEENLGLSEPNLFRVNIKAPVEDGI